MECPFCGTSVEISEGEKLTCRSCLQILQRDGDRIVPIGRETEVRRKKTSIPWTCGSCGKYGKAPAEQGGKTAACSCGATIDIPITREVALGLASDPSKRDNTDETEPAPYNVAALDAAVKKASEADVPAFASDEPDAVSETAVDEPSTTEEDILDSAHGEPAAESGSAPPVPEGPTKTSIPWTCEACGKFGKAPAEQGGQTAVCSCGATINIPINRDVALGLVSASDVVAAAQTDASQPTAQSDVHAAMALVSQPSVDADIPKPEPRRTAPSAGPSIEPKPAVAQVARSPWLLVGVILIGLFGIAGMAATVLTQLGDDGPDTREKTPDRIAYEAILEEAERLVQESPPDFQRITDVMAQVRTHELAIDYPERILEVQEIALARSAAENGLLYDRLVDSAEELIRTGDEAKIPAVVRSFTPVYDPDNQWRQKGEASVEELLRKHRWAETSAQIEEMLVRRQFDALGPLLDRAEALAAGPEQAKVEEWRARVDNALADVERGEDPGDLTRVPPGDAPPVKAGESPVTPNENKANPKQENTFDINPVIPRRMLFYPHRGVPFVGDLVAADQSRVHVRTENRIASMAWNELQPQTIVRILQGSMEPDRLAAYAAKYGLHANAQAMLAAEGEAQRKKFEDVHRQAADAFFDGASGMNHKQLKRAVEDALEEREEEAAAAEQERKRKLLTERKVTDVETLVSQGDVAKRLDIVIISDGWTVEGLSAFRKQSETCARRIVEVEPFRNYPSYINIHRIAIAERTSGLTGQTALRSSLNGDTLSCDRRAAIQYAQLAPDADLVIVITNTTQGRATGGGGVLTLNAAGDVNDTAIHEIGHALGGLDDEYVDPGSESRFPDYGPAQEPLHINTTRVSDPKKVKWHYWIKDMPRGTEVGLFEGGYYRSAGYYRPSPKCRMNRSTDPYCPVCFEQMEKSLYQFVSPIDNAYPSESLLSVFRDEEVEFSADAVVTEGPGKDLGSLSAMWWVDGEKSDDYQAKGRRTSLKLRRLKLEAGKHEIALRVDFHNKRVRRDHGLLSGQRVWTVNVLPYRRPDINFRGDAKMNAEREMSIEVDLESFARDLGLTLNVQEAPVGSTFVPETGAFTWTPTPLQTGAHVLRVGLIGPNDELLAVEETTLVVTYPGKSNLSPLLFLPETFRIAEGQVFSTRFSAFDTEGDSLVYRVEDAPVGAWIDSATGDFYWPVGYSQGGKEVEINVIVTDGGSLGTVEQIVKLVVEDRYMRSARNLKGFDLIQALRSSSARTRMDALTRLDEFPLSFQVLEASRLLRDRESAIRKRAIEMIERRLEQNSGEAWQRLVGMFLEDMERHVWHFTDAPEVLDLLQKVDDSTAKFYKLRRKGDDLRDEIKAVRKYNEQRGA